MGLVLHFLAGAELGEGFVEGPLEAGFLAGDAVEDAVVAVDDEGVVLDAVEPVLFGGVLEIVDAAGVVGGFHVVEAEEAPLGHGQLADECLFGGGGGAALG